MVGAAVDSAAAEVDLAAASVVGAILAEEALAAVGD